MIYRGPVFNCRNYVPRVQVFGDSIPYGVGAATLASWREIVYFLLQQLGWPLYFVGSNSFGGASGGLDVDPFCECFPGYSIASPGLIDISDRVATYRPDVVILDAGTNDLNPAVLDASAAATAANMSAWLDAIWSFRTVPWFRIIVCNVLPAFDGYDDRIDDYNALLPGVIASKSYSDSIALADQHDGSNLIYPDDFFLQIHPNDSGYTKIGQYLTTPILQQLQLARGP